MQCGSPPPASVGDICTPGMQMCARTKGGIFGDERAGRSVMSRLSGVFSEARC